MRVHNKPLLVIYKLQDIPEAQRFIELWQKLAAQNGLDGLYVVANIDEVADIERMRALGADAVNLKRTWHYLRHYSIPQRVANKILRVVLKHGMFHDYGRAIRWFSGPEDRRLDVHPCLMPQFDHSPRSGRNYHNLKNSTPALFQRHAERVFQDLTAKPAEERLAFLASWNEWGEGNYMEPDLRFGHGYLDALAAALSKF